MRAQPGGSSPSTIHLIAVVNSLALPQPRPQRTRAAACADRRTSPVPATDSFYCLAHRQPEPVARGGCDRCGCGCDRKWRSVAAGRPHVVRLCFNMVLDDEWSDEIEFPGEARIRI